MAHADLTARFHRERGRCAALAAALLAILIAYATVLSLSPRASLPVSGADALLFSIALAAVSGLGIVATARPSDCFALLGGRRRTEASRGPQADPAGDSSFPLRAHHCSCGRFADHVVHIGHRTVCAGCLGMAAGGACGIDIAVTVGAGLWSLDGTAALAMTALGAAASAAGLFQLYRTTSPMVHTAANLAFVAGAALLAALLSTYGLAAGAFGLLAALALVGLRIEMSRWRHLSVYAECPWQGTCRGASALEAERRPTRQ